MIVWGGSDYDLFSLKTGARYRRSTDDWTPVATTGAPASRWQHSAIWTGSKMIVWGGYHVDMYSVGKLNDGAGMIPVQTVGKHYEPQIY